MVALEVVSRVDVVVVEVDVGVSVDVGFEDVDRDVGAAVYCVLISVLGSGVIVDDRINDGV